MDPSRIPQSFEAQSGEWTENEKIYLALQMYQQRNERLGSQVPASQVLFDQLGNYPVDWDNLPMPIGRTVAQGRTFYQSHSRRSSGPSTALSAGRSPGSYAYSLPGVATAVGGGGGATGAVTSRKRSLPIENLTPQTGPGGRLIAPKQPHSYPSEGGSRPSITGHYPPSSMVDPQPPPHYMEPRKRRGRPTKAEQEERRRMLGERTQQRLQTQAPAPYGGPFAPLQTHGYGNVGPYPPTSLGAMKAPSTEPIGSTGNEVAQTPQREQTETEQTSSGSSGSKRRKARPPRLSTSDLERVPPPTFNATAYSSPPQTGADHDRHSSTPALTSGALSASLQIEPQERRPHSQTSEDVKPPQTRSRPWEVTGRSEP